MPANGEVVKDGNAARPVRPRIPGLLVAFCIYSLLMHASSDRSRVSAAPWKACVRSQVSKLVCVLPASLTATTTARFRLILVGAAGGGLAPGFGRDVPF